MSSQVVFGNFGRNIIFGMATLALSGNLGALSVAAGWSGVGDIGHMGA